MAIKATNQIDLVDLTDGYSVILSNDSHTFIGSTTTALAGQQIAVQVMAFRGDDQIACTVGTITPPTGLTAVNGGQTPAPVITFSTSTALVAGGSVNLPVVIGDITINKKFTFAIAFKGVDGTSITITSTEVKYASSASGTTAPEDGSNWKTNVGDVTITAGQFLWTRTKVNYSDNKSTTAYSVARYGQDGSGVTITSTEIKYASSTSGTTAPADGSNWKSDIASVTIAPGQFLWTRTKVNYSDSKNTTSYSVARYGEDGEDGDDAILLIITSSAGTIFKNTAVATTLTAHVYKGGLEVTGTALTALGTIKWYKNGTYLSGKNGATLNVTAGDVTDKATYSAQLES